MNISDYSGVVSAGASVATILGSGIAAVWARLEYTNRKIQESLKQCEKREIAGRERRLAMTTVIEVLWMELKRLSPQSDVLRRSKKLLDDIKHKEFESDHDEDDL